MKLTFSIKDHYWTNMVVNKRETKTFGMADLSPPSFEKIMFWYSVNYRTAQYIVKKMWSEIISPKMGPFLTPKNDSKNMIGSSLNWLFWGSQKIVILGVCYKIGVSISTFASL